MGKPERNLFVTAGGQRTSVSKTISKMVKILSCLHEENVGQRGGSMQVGSEG